HILAELKVSLKVIYDLVMLLITLSVIRSWKSIKIKETIYRAITTVSIIISVSFWIAYLSKTTFSSYSYDKSGISGRYFSANELSAIIVILIGFTIAQVHEKRMDENTLQFCTLILLLSLTPMIGTKTALGGAIL